MQRIYIHIFKISAIVLSILIVLFVALVFIIHTFFQEKLVQYAVDQLNKQVDSKISIQKGELSVLKTFPNIAVEFTGINVQSANSFQTKNKIKNDTLLVAEKVFLQFNLFKLLNKKYVLKKIQVKNGSLNLIVLGNGSLNYDIFTKSSANDTTASDIQLRNVMLINTYINFLHKGSDIKVITFCDKLKLKGNINPRNSKLKITSDLLLYSVRINNTEYIHNRDLSIDMALDITDKINYKFSNTRFKLDNFSFRFQGFYSSGDIPFINFEFLGEKLNLSNVFNYLPDEYKANLTGYSTKGILNTSIIIKGDITKIASPSVNIKFDIDEGTVTSEKSKIKVYDINLGGSFTNGKKRNTTTSLLQVDRFLSKIGSGDFAIKAELNNLDSPNIEIEGVARIDLAELKEFLGLDTFEILHGKAEGSYAIKGNIDITEDFKLIDAAKFNYSGQITFSQAAFKLKQSLYDVKKIDGMVFISNDIDFRNITFTINDNAILLNGRLKDGLKYLLKETTHTILEADLSSNHIDLSKFFVKGNKNDTSAYSREILFPENFGLDIKLNANEFKLNKFEAKWVKGYLQYKPRMFILKSFSLECLDGRIQGNGAIIQDINKNFIVKGQVDLLKINIQQAFNTFNNFGQEILKDKNIRGKLSGKVNFSSQWNKYLIIQSDKLIMDADVSVTNGELINFEPMYGLSRFILLEELKNVRFLTLKNTIYIKDKQIIIPQMDINSNAFNISGSGTHYFDNHYKYKVKVLLSEILYGKAKSAKKENEEYGVIEDDGLGRTSLYLNIEGMGPDYKINYDSKKAIDVVKESLDKQKRELKSIFHDEFGWFKKDSVLQKQKNENSNKIKVTWEEESQSPADNSAIQKTKKNRDTENKVKVEWE